MKIHRSLVTTTLVLMLTLTALPQEKPAAAEKVLADAVQIAKIQDKNVLIHFGASWCSWCHKLDDMLESKEVGQLFKDNYVITHLTIQESKDKVALENPGAQAMVDAANAKGSGVPVYIFFDKEGGRLATSLAMPGARLICSGTLRVTGRLASISSVSRTGTAALRVSIIDAAPCTVTVSAAPWTDDVTSTTIDAPGWTVMPV
jgi:thioredoxin-related protein